MTQREHNQTCDITVMIQRRKEVRKRNRNTENINKRDVCYFTTLQESLYKHTMYVDTNSTTTHYGPPNIAPGMRDFTSLIHAEERQLVDSS